MTNLISNNNLTKFKIKKKHNRFKHIDIYVLIILKNPNLYTT